LLQRFSFACAARVAMAACNSRSRSRRDAAEPSQAATRWSVWRTSPAWGCGELMAIPIVELADWCDEAMAYWNRINASGE
jgi:hypothetical protein